LLPRFVYWTINCTKTIAGKIITYIDGTRPRAGLLVHERVYDLAAATGDETNSSVLALLQNPDEVREKLERGVAQAERSANGKPVDQVTLAAPILYPSAIYCAGSNYADHVREMAVANNRPTTPDPRASGLTPWFFVKPSRTVVADRATVQLPAASKAVDWEVELAAVIGRPARNVSVAEARDYVFGYTVANDLSARDLNRRPPLPETSPFFHDWLAHKGFDGACPLGPWITPASQVKDPQNLRLGLRLNGVDKQDSNTGEMIFDIAEQIAHLSSQRTLYPGDLVLTGTPAGVGAARREFLKPGDQIEAWIESVGTLHTTIAKPL
jgi:2-keto-4-pentenoate hydratase/2-oxohepta-3-ene-1,7-dioic acid hydratase in catechol pathway